MDNGKTYYRCLGLSADNFDYFKELQREYLRKHDIRLNNHEVLAIILREHKDQIGKA